MSLTELAVRFGEIPAPRICLEPPPGSAIEADLSYYRARKERMLELVDAVLIEKATTNYSSFVGGNIFGSLFSYVHERRLGFLLPASALFRLSDRSIRSPNVAYLTLQRGRRSLVANSAIAAVAPNLAVEVISEGNSQKEMADKLQEYFRAGTEEVWYVYPESRELHQFTSPTEPRIWQGDVQITTQLLPGLAMSLTEIFRLPGE